MALTRISTTSDLLWRQKRYKMAHAGRDFFGTELKDRGFKDIGRVDDDDSIINLRATKDGKTLIFRVKTSGTGKDWDAEYGVGEKTAKYESDFCVYYFEKGCKEHYIIVPFKEIEDDLGLTSENTLRLNLNGKKVTSSIDKDYSDYLDEKGWSKVFEFLRNK